MAALALAGLLATSCAAQDGDGSAPGKEAEKSPSATPHGYVEGAKEAAEQQSRLLLADPATGDGRVLDLVSGRVRPIERIPDASRLSTDGRFGYLHTPDGAHVVDSGSWMVDHGDHVHYYRAAVRDVGDLTADAAAEVRSDATVTAVTDGDGRARLYDRTELEDGRVGSPRALTGDHAAAVVPYKEHLLSLTEDGGSTKLTVHDRRGEPVAAPDAECEQPRGDAVTRRGVVLGCADGALLVRAEDGGFTAEKIAYGEEVPEKERATGFRHRPGSDTLTAPAGDRAVWVLDVTGRTWTRVETGPVVAANTAGEGSPLLVLESDGTLHGYDIDTGEQVSRSERLLTGTQKAGTGPGRPLIEVDRSRAYVNDPEGRRVYEIDYNDDLRTARTFDLDIAPGLMAETGR